jgi:uncharacterized protein (TIGR02300 family)
MVEPALGTKRHCQSCEKNYYDLNKSPITCPHCQKAFDPEALLKSRKVKPVAPVAPKKVEAPPPEDAIEEDLSDDIESKDSDSPESQEILEDDADLPAIKPDEDEDKEIISTEVAIEDELSAPEEEEEAEE